MNRASLVFNRNVNLIGINEVLQGTQSYSKEGSDATQTSGKHGLLQLLQIQL